MKKILFIVFTIIIIFVTIVFVRYMSYKNEYKQILKENVEFGQYKDKELYGIELATLINKAVDKNTQNEEKENSNSIEIEIYMQDNEQTYKMETFYNTGIQQYIQYYYNIKFKCSKIEYDKTTGRINYLLFEQNVTS